MTETLFRSDAYARSCEASVTAVNDRGGIILDRTVLYASAGGQPGDLGALTWEGGVCRIAATVYDADKTTIVHVPAEGSTLPAPGLPVLVTLDWETRHRHMRVHTALHLLCSLVKWPVTGGQIGAEEGRLDFDIADMTGIDKEALTAALNALVDADHAVSTRWITDAELEAQPHLVRTMSVKPPKGTGKVRLVAIGEDGSVDLQPCGGTHVAHTGEIGRLSVVKIESKGKQNRRIRIALA